MASNENKRTKVGEGYAVVLYHDRDSCDIEEFNPEALERAIIDVMNVTPKRASEIVIDTLASGRRIVTITTRKNAAQLIMGFDSHGVEAGIITL